MQQTQKSRMENDLDSWKRIEDKLIERYGSGVTKDRSLMKAKRDIYKHIADKNKNKRLNQYEKAELRVIRGQHRNLLRQIYPNPYVRLARNMLVFAGNVVKLIGDAGFKAAKWLIAPDRRQYAGAGVRNAVAQNPRGTPKIAPSQNKAVVRKLTPRPRIRMPRTAANVRMRR